MVGRELQKIINEVGLSPENFAEKIGVTKGGLYKVIGGDTKKITPALAKKISKAYPKYSVQDLLALNHKSEFVLDESILSDKDKLSQLARFLLENHDELMKDAAFEGYIKARVITPYLQQKKAGEIGGLLNGE